MSPLKRRLIEETPFWCEKFAKIVDKRGRLIDFHLKPGQVEADRRLEAQRADGKPARMIILKARQIGFCLDPSTRVLTSDLQWVRIDDVLPGQELVAVDEEPPGGKGNHRRLRQATVEGKAEVRKQAFRLTMVDGRVLVATKQHRFLCRSSAGARWRQVARMKPGDLIRHVVEPWDEPGYEDGWLGGLIDGEGCLRRKERAGVELSISQRPNGVLDRARRYLQANRYTVREDTDDRTPENSQKFGRNPVGRLIVNRINELFRLIGQTRPERMIGTDWWTDKELPGKRSGEAWVQIAAIEPLTVQRMIDLQTSTGTFIAEGFVSHNSTLMQAKLLHRCTLRERYNAVTVAHDKETGGKLYRMAETIYGHLPDDPWLKPALGQHRRQHFLHFAGDGQWQRGDLFPDSYYSVDTAGEFQAGRGGTYRAIHASEVAFWQRINEKLTALMSAVPDDPDTMFVMESTANGFNEFKDWWDDAYEGRSEWTAFFWPWWKDDEYQLAFASPAEKERFIVGDPSNPYAEEEPDLVRHFGLTLEQLSWRRRVIANKGGGDIRYFHQEYPSTPEEAFISTGQKVFDPYRTAQLLVRVEVTDPRTPTPEHPGPLIGDLEATAHRTDPTQSGGTIEVPTAARFVPRERGVPNPTAPWRLWLPGDGEVDPAGEYVVAADPSGGKMETTDEPDYHAVQVIDLETREQVAEYRSRIEVALLTREILLAAILFNQATIAIERTGGWGIAPLSILYNDFHYPHIFRSKRTGSTSERVEHRLGWDTNVRTKPKLIAGMAELLRTEEDGIKSRALANEVRTYTRTERGTTEAEPGKYDDLLMAYMIGQEVARGLPRRGQFASHGDASAFTARPGVGAYDGRYR